MKNRSAAFNENPFSLPFMKNRSAAFNENPFSLPLMENRSACLQFLNEEERHGECHS
jgi:hypothetical protein